ncbi:ABC transporter substrate-binding protein [Archangium sp. Cb G35]|uniref:ABC transporter permease n=1 Tax=Archangium sp. Cb G35 TaxID=1920190 RepID=UPI000937CC83|nr:ABC transporter permease [Archangium sp. Cb G35]OJT21380.1 ABC transporter substrate-binding protein [Archangium sp. Cb G35]
MLAFLDNLRLALTTLVGNPLRSLLTLLGIVIGVTTVIAMMGLIEGLRLKVNGDLAQLGSNTFELNKWPLGLGRFDWQKYAKRKNITMEDVALIRQSCPSVAQVSASLPQWGQKVASVHAQTRPSVEIKGATPEAVETSSLVVSQGRFLHGVDEQEERYVAVLGMDVADALFPKGTEPLGGTVRIQDRPFTVVGLLQRRGSFLGLMSMDNIVYIPMSTFQNLYGKSRSLDVKVQALSGELMSQAEDEVTVLMRRRRGLNEGQPNDFELHTNESMTRMFNELSAVISAASFGVCLLSLLVGGIGILNIMLVSVTERTREIGIRKALGARKRRILGQFATEAVMLALVGGVLGVGLGYGVTFLARWVAGVPTVVPAWAVALSLGMSSGVGLLFGIYPAARAARLDPVEAMRAD